MSDTPEAGAPKRAPIPWWMPDARGWVSLGLWVLSLVILVMLDRNPELQDNKLFFGIAGGVFGGGGLLAVIGFYFVASKRDHPQNGGGQ